MNALARSVPGSRDVGSAPVLKVAGLCKRYGGLKVFEDINLSVQRGEVIGVIGPNGAGKTTLINVLSGASRPTAGTIHLNGRDITGRQLNSTSRLGAVRSFQQTNTFTEKTVRENLLFALQFSGRTTSTALGADELLSEFDLLRRLDEQAGKLPYGSQKMLGLLMAFLARPQLLLLDEPAAGIEHNERESIATFIDVARRRLSCSILIVEHDIALIRRLCSRVVMLDGGKILAEGTPEYVLSRPDVLSAYVGEPDEEDVC